MKDEVGNNYLDDLHQIQEDIEKTKEAEDEIGHSIHETAQDIERLQKEVEQVLLKEGLSLPMSEKGEDTKSYNGLNWDDMFFLSNNPILLDHQIKNEILKKPKLLPSLSGLDYAIVGIAGFVASIVDILFVRLPKDIKYLNQYNQKGSEFTAWLRTLGIDENGNLHPFLQWCEDVCKVPYDKSNDKRVKGMGGKTHRLLSLGHDPLFGLIFGLLDIFNGSLTAIDIQGNFINIKTYDPGLTKKLLSPFLWLGHIVSDVCTSMGIPIPGWGFLQLLQFGSFGKKDRTIAEISKWMYLNGYDLRHFITMSVSPAIIEIIVRGYHYLSLLNSEKQLVHSMTDTHADTEITKMESNLKLHKMLFLSHAFAAGGNAFKIFINQGNPLALNISQWIMLLKESIKMTKAVTRDKKLEMIIRNRNKIDEEWEAIKGINVNRNTSVIYYDFFKERNQKEI
ncbi:MAG: hypothetical protein GX115_01885 [Ruminiclostridium sp.]|nr:hypothetical protein [Ruminiclostridium sp.]